MMWEDGTGSGYRAKVNKENLAYTRAVRLTEARWVAERNGLAFNVIGINKELAAASVAPGTPVLYLMNDDAFGRLAIIYSVKCQALDLATTGSFSDTTYCDLLSGYTTPSNGTQVYPRNANFSSGNTSTLRFTAYEGSGGTLLSLAGTGTVFTRTYVQANMIEHEMLPPDMAVVLGQGQSLTCNLITDFTTGRVAAKFALYLADPA
jgi:hypothetical protein